MTRKTAANPKTKPKAKGGSTYANKPKVKVKPKTKRDARKSDTKELRCAPTFYVIRAFCIHFLAEQGMPTEEIAQRLDVNRSFVIKQSTLVMTPRTEQEKRIYDIAKTMSEAFRLANIDGLLFGRDLVTKLAGRVSTPPANSKAMERMKARVEKPNILAESLATSKTKKGRPSAKKLKLAAPQKPLDMRD
jgi:hypothetical protein